MAATKALAFLLLATSNIQLASCNCAMTGFDTEFGAMTLNCSGAALDSSGLFFVPSIHLILCNDCTATTLGHDDSLKDVEEIKMLRLIRLKLGTQKKNSFLPYNDRGLQSLEVTYTRKGDLRQLRKHFFSGLSNLTLLNLQHNNIEKIEAGAFDNTHRIESLKLDHNPLSGLAASSFAGLSHVGELSLQNASGLHRLRPQLFDGLRHVDSVVIKNCPLTHVETGAFRGLEDVKHIHISYTPLETIKEGAFSGIAGKVHSLDLSHNKLRSLSTGLVSASWDLKRLDLRHNQLTSVQAALLPAAALQGGTPQLKLQHNPLSCDCDLLWLVQFHQRRAENIQSTWESLLANTHCALPTLAEPYLGQNGELYERCESRKVTLTLRDEKYRLVQVTATTHEPGQRHVLLGNGACAATASLVLALLACCSLQVLF